jgi:hypothetical protein
MAACCKDFKYDTIMAGRLNKQPAVYCATTRFQRPQGGRVVLIVQQQGSKGRKAAEWFLLCNNKVPKKRSF